MSRYPCDEPISNVSVHTHANMVHLLLPRMRARARTRTRTHARTHACVVTCSEPGVLARQVAATQVHLLAPWRTRRTLGCMCSIILIKRCGFVLFKGTGRGAACASAGAILLISRVGSTETSSPVSTSCGEPTPCMALRPAQASHRRISFRLSGEI